jgi:hypothetical protein
MASEQLRKDLMTEYFKVYDAVTEYDKRLLTVKGWGVTLSLAAIAWGFEKNHSGLFLVAALSGAGFWAIEAVFKRYQMRFYVRMRDIEVTCFDLFAEAGSPKVKVSSPLISWSWFVAPEYYCGHLSGPLPPPARLQSMPKYNLTWSYAGVAFPHVISVVAGVALFLLCQYDYLGIKSL